MAGPPWIIDPDAWDRVRSMADSFSDVQALFELLVNNGGENE